MRLAPVRARCWWCVGSPEWGNRRCWSIWPSGRRAVAWSVPRELVVGGGSALDAGALLVSATHGRLDDRVRDRISGGAHGNPLGLLGLTGGLPPAGLAGGFGLPGAQVLAGRIEDSFQRRLAAL